MADLVLTTFDWVPQGPRGWVRDLRVRWALEEAGLPYAVATTPFRDRSAGHLAHQPFGQVPWLTDGDISIFESGAILLHLGGLSLALMPGDTRGRGQVTEWMFAALNSVEMVSAPWVMARFFAKQQSAPQEEGSNDLLDGRLDKLEPVFAAREWLAGSFSVADIAMSDVLRIVDKFDGLSRNPACRGYVERATARPAFRKAYADQMAHFAAADRAA